MPTLSFTINLNSTDTAVLAQIHSQLVANSHYLETIMASNAELQASLDALTQANAENAAADQAEMAQLAAAVAAIPVGEPVTQEQLDQVNAVVASMQARTVSLVADDAPATPPTE